MHVCIYGWFADFSSVTIVLIAVGIHVIMPTFLLNQIFLCVGLLVQRSIYFHAHNIKLRRMMLFSLPTVFIDLGWAFVDIALVARCHYLLGYAREYGAKKQWTVIPCEYLLFSGMTCSGCGFSDFGEDFYLNLRRWYDNLRRKFETFTESKTSSNALILLDVAIEASSFVPDESFEMVKCNEALFDWFVDDENWKMARQTGSSLLNGYLHYYPDCHPVAGLHLFKLGERFSVFCKSNETSKQIFMQR